MNQEIQIREKEILSIDIYSMFGIFKKYDINESLYLTYNWIPKPFLLGIFGSILGLEGYGSISPSTYKTELKVPEYYEKLKDLKLAILPISRNLKNINFNGVFKKTVIKYNNSLGYASQEQGNILNVSEQILISPSYRIFIDIFGFSNKNLDLAKKLKYYLKNNLAEYLPYMGKNEFPLNWDNYQEYQLIDKEVKEVEIHSIFKKETLLKGKEIKTPPLTITGEKIKARFMVFEKIPVDFIIDKKRQKNKVVYFYHYKLEEFVFTNIKFAEKPVQDLVWIQNQENKEEYCIQFI